MMNWNDYGKMLAQPNLRHYPGICLEGLIKTMENISHDSWYLEPATYGTGVVTTQS
jgi:hypothetical protein